MQLSKTKNKIISIILCLLAVFFVCFEHLEDAFAAEQGTVGAVQLRLREGPGTEFPIVTELKINSTVAVNSKGYFDVNHDEWYNVTSSSGKTGYVMGKYIVIEPTAVYSYEGDFEAWLTSQGFPDSYKPYLRELHAKYPKWVFKAAKTRLNWNEVINLESKPGRSLIPSSSPDSWKSMEQGCYNFETGSYVSYDSGGWVTAARNVVEYYMDPRNFINSANIFQFLTHSYDATTQNIDGLKTMLSGTFMDGLYPEGGYETWADLLMTAGISAGVNPYVLASMILQEQGSNGIGGCISGTQPGYEGYYNFFNIGAYKTSTMTAVQRGLWYASQAGSYGRPWSTRAASIIGGAQFYAENYVNENKNTLYFKKWNVMNGISSVGTYQYMTNAAGAYSEGTSLRNGYLTALDTAMTFLIPVYDNMPTTACPEPKKSGNENNFLISLDIDGYDLTPEFNMYTTDYELVVGTTVSSVNVQAIANASNAIVTGTGTHVLSSDNTRLSISVVSSSGAIKTYNIDISKMAGGQTANGTPSLESSAYSVGSYITGVQPKTGYDVFSTNLVVNNGYILIQNASGNIITSGNIGTGCKVVLLDKLGNTVTEYEVKINGDINGDGKIGTADLLTMQKHIVGSESVKGIYQLAADINGDGKISTADLLNLRKSIVGGYDIVQ